MGPPGRSGEGALSEALKVHEVHEMHEIRRAWLQKHPTPVAGAGEFHWYPAAATPDEARLRGWVVEQVQGSGAPAVWWELLPGRVIWASVFSAISPTDARPYRGVALSVAEGAASLSAAALLARLVPAAPKPWSAQMSRGSAGAPAGGPDQAAWQHPLLLARAVLGGGLAPVEDPHDPALPARLAPLVALLPPELSRHPRRGQLRRAAEGTSAPPGEHAAADPLAALLVAAWQAEGAARRRARAAWTLLGELAFAGERGGQPDETEGDAADDAGGAEAALLALEDALAHGEEARARAVTPAELERWLDDDQRARWRRHCEGPPASWQRLLHGWGRGWLDGSEGAARLPRRLAEELALRALAALRAGDEAAAVIAEARWHALLPAAQRRALLTALARRAPSLWAESLGAGSIAAPSNPPTRPWKESADVA